MLYVWLRKNISTRSNIKCLCSVSFLKVTKVSEIQSFHHEKKTWKRLFRDNPGMKFPVQTWLNYICWNFRSVIRVDGEDLFYFKGKENYTFRKLSKLAHFIRILAPKSLSLYFFHIILITYVICHTPSFYQDEQKNVLFLYFFI